MSAKVLLRVDNNVTYVSGRLDSDAYKELKKVLGYYPEDSFWMVRNSVKEDENGNPEKGQEWKQNWDGLITTVCWSKRYCKCSVKKDGPHFPSGLLSKAIGFFNDYNIEYSIEDIRIKTLPTTNYSMSKEFEFRDYQQNIINRVSGTKDYKGIDRGLIKCATGAGKCISLESLCLTENGMVEIGEIESGLENEEYREKKINVYTPIGKNNRDISSHIYRDGVKDSIKVITSYGYAITGTPNHRVIVVGDNGNFEWKRLDQISDKDIVVLSKNQNMFGDNDKWTVEEAYLLGLLYGDGSFNKKDSIAITTEDDHIEEYVSAYEEENGMHSKVSYDKRTEKTRSVCVYNTVYKDSLVDKGVDYCVAHTKEIPLSIRTAPRSVVAAFLRGIYETDGCVEVNKKKMSITLGLSNEKLIDQIHYILLNMGIVSSKRKKSTYRKDCFILTIYRDFIKKFIDTIGLDPEEYKREKSHEYYNNFIYRKNNSNKDLIYNQNNNIREIKCIIKNILGSKKYRSIIEKESDVKINVLRSWLGKSCYRHYSRSSLLSFLRWAEYRFIIQGEGSNHYEYNRLKSIISDLLEVVNDKYYYDTIKSIEHCRSDNYDFVIPNTHSFVSNGFINHNTGIASGIIAAMGVSPTIFYVPSVDLLEQAKNELERFIRYHGENFEVGIIGGGQKKIRDINVMTIQTAVRSLGGVWVKFDDEDGTKKEEQEQEFADRNKEEIRELIQGTKLMLCDEVQHWASETCQIISDNSINCQYRYGLSATPYRDKGDDILIDACFGKTIADINASFLIKRGYLVKPIIYFDKVDNMRGITKSSYANIYKQAIVENEYRNNRIITFAELFRERGRKVLILVKQINHGNLLEKLIPGSVFLHGGTSKKKRIAHLDKMRENIPHVTIASVIFDEGIDCKPLDTLILGGSGKSPTRALQRIGRILRPYPNKDGAIAMDFMDDCKYMKSHSLKRKSIYETEEEFDIRSS